MGATLVMDVWALLLKRAFNIPSANYCLVGRWFRHMPEGKLAVSPLLRKKGSRCVVLGSLWIGTITHSYLSRGCQAAGARPTFAGLALEWAACSCLTWSCNHCSDSALPRQKRRGHGRPGCEASWRMQPLESGSMFVLLP